MKFRGINTSETQILNLLYRLRTLDPMPYDLRVVDREIAKALGQSKESISRDINSLANRGLVLTYFIGKTRYSVITIRGIKVVERSKVSKLQAELSTSRIGIKSEEESIQ